MELLEFTQTEIEDLADKLSALASLTNPERELLVAIFAAAADRAKPVAPTGPEGQPKQPAAVLPVPVVPNQAPGAVLTQADLKQALLKAYVPGNDFNSLIETSSSGKVTEIHPS